MTQDFGYRKYVACLKICRAWVDAANWDGADCVQAGLDAFNWAKSQNAFEAPVQIYDMTPHDLQCAMTDI